jgi:hypothetical protein
MAEALKRSKGVAEALQFVADHPVQSSPDTIDVPVWELIARQLFYVANNPDARKRGSMARATKAQRMIFDRLVGRRRPGTHPAQLAAEGLEFTDLTVGVLEAASAAESDEEEQA